MASWEFTLVVEGVDLQDEQTVEALFEAGLDDAMISRSAGVQLVDVDRDADSYAGALLSALRQLRLVAPAGRVVRVEPDQLVTMAEVAERYARSRESIRLLMAGERGPGGFPAPLSHASQRTRLWRWADVVAWFRIRLGEEPHGEQPGKHDLVERVNAAVNARLEWERYRSGLDEADRRELDDVLAE